MSSVRVLLCTCPPGAAEAIAKRLLERRLCACVNEIRGVTSRYRWEGRLEREEESLLVIKTAQERVLEVIAELEEWHPYELPELLSLAVEQGSRPYLDWVRDETDGEAPPRAPQ